MKGDKNKRHRATAPGDSGHAAEWVPTASLIPWKGNPRQNDDNVARVAESIARFGWASPIVARRENGEVIAGHTRLKAAESLGIATVPVRFMDISEADAHLLALADNRLNELSPWDTPRLQELLSEYGLESAALAGWTSDDLEKMASELIGDSATPEPEVVEDEVPEPPKEPVTQPGDVWELGDHVLVCGDCRDSSTVRAIVGDGQVNVAFTSPPYASQRKYDESSGFKPIHPDEFVDWFDAVQANVRDVLAPDGSWFVNIKPASAGLDTQLYVFDLVLAHARKWGWHYAAEFCWERAGIPGKPSRRFKNQFEPIYHFARNEWKFRPEQVRHETDELPKYNRGNHWAGGLTNETQGSSGDRWVDVGAGLAYPGNRLSAFSSAACGHPAAFPVGLPSFFIKAYSDAGDAVLDPFCGSGTTLIACEQLGRRCFGVEISPAYCDVVVERWQNLTGKKAVRRGK